MFILTNPEMMRSHATAIGITVAIGAFGMLYLMAQQHNDIQDQRQVASEYRETLKTLPGPALAQEVINNYYRLDAISADGSTVFLHAHGFRMSCQHDTARSTFTSCGIVGS